MAAIRSARANTSLDIAVMYDGDAPEFLDFLAAHDVRCIQQRFSLADDPTFWPDPPDRLSFRRNDRAICGAFMPFDVPGLFLEEDYILYTDTDVIFQRDPASLLQVERPEFIAGVSYGKSSCWPVGPAPQSRPYINTGVLVINVQAWVQEFDALVDTSKRFEWGRTGREWNEGIINQHFDKRIKFLRRTFNWRPWMGVFEAAPIVHYHGARPEHLTEYLEWGIESPDLPSWARGLWQAGGSGYGQHAEESCAVDMTRDIARYYVDLYKKYDIVVGSKIPRDLWPPRGPCGPRDNHKTTRFQQLYAVSETFCGYLKKYAELVPTSDVLEVGFGAGRMGRVLWDYVSPGGSYSGLDVIKEMVDWHTDNITPRRPNAKFFHADVKNESYAHGPDNQAKPSTYVFPFDDGSFDVVLLASVFTHMFPADVANYLREIKRVLRPGGCVLATCFLIDEQVVDNMASGAATRAMRPLEGHLATWTDAPAGAPPEACIGLGADNHRAAYEAAGLELVHFCIPGRWSGREQPVSFQDMVVAKRPVLDSV